MTTTRHARALAWAKSALGEGEVPPGSNTGPFVQSCQAATWLAGTHWPWCVAFFQKAWQEAGYKLPWLGAGAYAMLDWAKTVGWAVTWKDAVPGDGVILNIGAGHCAMLSAPVEDDGKVPTISGNFGDKVATHTFDISQVRGFIHVPADPHVPPAQPRDPAKITPAKPPVYEVVTSASGHKKLVYVSGEKAIGRKIGSILNRWGGVTISRKK